MLDFRELHSGQVNSVSNVDFNFIVSISSEFQEWFIFQNNCTNTAHMLKSFKNLPSIMQKK